MRILFCFIIYCFFQVAASAQPQFTYSDINYRKDKGGDPSLKTNGKVNISISYIYNDGDVGFIDEQPTDDKPAKIDLKTSYLSKARLRITFYYDFKPSYLKKNAWLIAPPECYTGGSSLLKPLTNNTLIVKENSKTRENQIEYAILGEGEGQLFLKFSMVDRNYSDLHVTVEECIGNIKIPFQVFNARKKPPCEKDWEELDTEDCIELNNYLNEYGDDGCFSGKAKNNLNAIQTTLENRCFNRKDTNFCNQILDCFEGKPVADRARKLIESVKNPVIDPPADEREWKRIQYSKRIEDFENFISNFGSSDYVAAARRKIKALKGDDQVKVRPSSPDRVAWNNIKTSTDPQDFLQFIQEFPESKYRDEADEAVRRYSEIKYELNSLDKGRYSVKFVNVTNPRFKDISLTEGLKIIEENWDFDRSLLVMLERSGVFKILVRDDEWNKQTTVSFSDQIEASKIEKTEDGYQGKIEGGTPPYRIRFINSETEDPEAHQIVETAGTYILDPKILKTLNGTNYTLEVTDKNKSLPVPIDGEVEIEKTPIDENIPLLIALGGILVLIIIITIISLIRARRKKRYSSIYQR